MIDSMFDLLFGSLFESTGSIVLVMVVLMVLFTLAFVYLGMDYEFALILISSLPYGFYKEGYLDVWIAVIFIVVPLGFGLYSAYNRFMNKY